MVVSGFALGGLVCGCCCILWMGALFYDFGLIMFLLCCVLVALV